MTIALAMTKLAEIIERDLKEGYTVNLSIVETPYGEILVARTDEVAWECPVYEGDWVWQPTD